MRALGSWEKGITEGHSRCTSCGVETGWGGRDPLNQIIEGDWRMFEGVRWERRAGPIMQISSAQLRCTGEPQEGVSRGGAGSALGAERPLWNPVGKGMRVGGQGGG